MLRADLAAWTKLADSAKQHARIRQALQRRQTDAALAGIRSAEAHVLARSPDRDNQPDRGSPCRAHTTSVSSVSIAQSWL